MKTKFRPLADRVVVKQKEAETKTPGGVIIPESGQERPLEGEVLSVGPGRFLEDGTRRAPEVQVGQVVLFGKYAGTDHTVEGEKIKILREDEVIGIIETVQKN